MEEELSPVSASRRQYFMDRNLTRNGVATPCRLTCNCKVNGKAGALNGNSMRAVVTGGGGYCGYKLGCALASAGASVVLYDIHKPIWEIPNGVECIQVGQIIFSQQSKLVNLPFPYCLTTFHRIQMSNCKLLQISITFLSLWLSHMVSGQLMYLK